MFLKKYGSFAAVFLLLIGLIGKDWFFITIALTGGSIISPSPWWDYALLGLIVLMLIARARYPKQTSKIMGR